MVIEIEKTEAELKEEAEAEAKEKPELIVNCRMCKHNFNPTPYECPYLYHPAIGLHIPMCAECREMLRKERMRLD